ncbi:hypothetical protein BMS3Bbin11_01313 [bacterium BMS3Bbin11]|nr:hypothetical protein BMS3Bbin11_01313 [bacterium BMS3Bbin11]
MVCPDILVTISPGLLASPSGRFSELGTIAITFSGRFISAMARMVPRTLAPPHMSYFISSIADEGFKEIPPASKVSPFPTSTTGASLLLPPLCSRTINLASCRLPRDTDSNAPIDSFSIAFSFSTLIFMPKSSAISDACPAR